MTATINGTTVTNLHIDLSQATPEQCFMIGKSTYEFIQRLMSNPDTAKKLQEKTLDVKRRNKSTKERSVVNESEFKHDAVTAECQEVQFV